jgi:hypothetical protein
MTLINSISTYAFLVAEAERQVAAEMERLKKQKENGGEDPSSSQPTSRKRKRGKQAANGEEDTRRTVLLNMRENKNKPKLTGKNIAHVWTILTP